jgi:hypothetical protein
MKMKTHTVRSIPAAFSAAALALGVLVLPGCGASMGSVDFKCIPDVAQINGGLLLTVDIIRATDDEARRITELGEKWFYEQMRMNLRDRIQTVTFPAAESSMRCDRVVQVKVVKGERTLIVIADYKFQNPDTTKHILVFPFEKWAGRKIKVSVEDRELHVQTYY